MKEMIKKIKEERGGFTLAELLVVVAIVAVLVAIAVPVFTGALGGANEAVGQSAVRSVKAEAVSKYLLDKETGEKTYYAQVDSKGNVTGITLTAPTKGDGVDVFDTSAADAADDKTIGESISNDKTTTWIGIKIKADDVSSTPNN